GVEVDPHAVGIERELKMVDEIVAGAVELAIELNDTMRPLALLAEVTLDDPARAHDMAPDFVVWFRRFVGVAAEPEHGREQQGGDCGTRAMLHLELNVRYHAKSPRPDQRFFGISRTPRSARTRDPARARA